MSNPLSFMFGSQQGKKPSKKDQRRRDSAASDSSTATIKPTAPVEYTYAPVDGIDETPFKRGNTGHLVYRAEGSSIPQKKKEIIVALPTGGSGATLADMPVQGPNQAAIGVQGWADVGRIKVEYVEKSQKVVIGYLNRKQ